MCIYGILCKLLIYAHAILLFLNTRIWTTCFIRWGEVNWCFTPFFNHVWLHVAVSFHSWRNKLFLGVNQQPSVSNCQLPLMWFEPQWRGASSFKARRLNHSATEAPVLYKYCIIIKVKHIKHNVVYTSHTVTIYMYIYTVCVLHVVIVLGNTTYILSDMYLLVF